MKTYTLKWMRYTGVFFLLVISAISSEMKPEKVYRYIYVAKSHEWYVEQAKLWAKELVKRQNDAKAWQNYFMAMRYAHWQGDKELYQSITDSILTEMEKYVPDSYEYNYLKFYNGERDIQLLRNAYKIDPQRPDALYEFILIYEKNDEPEKQKKICAELYNSKDIASGLLDYNYNMLMSVEKNALLFTNGDNDSYPSWVLQQTFGIRTDVTVMNLHMTFVDRDYLKRKLSEKGIEVNAEQMSKEDMAEFFSQLCDAISAETPHIPVYAAVTVYESTLRNVKENLYLVGLAFKFNSKRFDNIASIRDNIENHMRLDYLNYDWYGEKYLVNEGLDQLHLNYVVVFLKLAEYYHLKGVPDLATRWKRLSIKLAKKAENESFIKHINELEW